ncbi:MAG: hypothetical protein AB1813_23215 [Verrucomicrobiota bacterium]
MKFSIIDFTVWPLIRMQEKDLRSELKLRLVVFSLAATSLGCLLGQMWGFWSMRAFACLILLPATAALVYLAWRFRGQPASRWIVHGAIGGVVAACAYDLFRVPFVLNGAPLFRVFFRFGEMLWGSAEPAWLIHALGWTYHFSNGAALGIMALTLIPRAKASFLFWGAVVWACFIEAMLLLTPYPTYFGFRLNSRFILITFSAHLVFGIVLGIWLARFAVAPRALTTEKLGR